MYEGYGPGGIAVLVEVLTDNKNRAVAELRHVFSKQGGNLAESGAVNWMFEHKGVIKAVGGSLTEDDLLEKLIDFDIDDVSKQDDLVNIVCDMTALNEIKDAVKTLGLTVEHAEIEWVAKDPLELDDEKGERAMEFLDALDSLDDIQNLYSNLG